MSQKSFGNNIFKEYIPKLGLWSKTMRTVLCAINIEFFCMDETVSSRSVNQNFPLKLQFYS